MPPQNLTTTHPSATITPQEYQRFSVFLEQACGIVLGEHKHYLVTSRLYRLLSEYALPSVSELIRQLEGGRVAGLRERIIDAMTTNETLWFRDAQPFEALKQEILPDLAQRTRQVRMWSAACSSGQEPYSISIAVQEYLQGKPGALPGGVQIIATDISPSMLKEAAAGQYDEASLARGLSAERKQRFFSARDAGKWEIKAGIKNRVIFKELNLMKSYAALGKFDVVFCRNVLIYFSGALKVDILTRIAQTLNPHGYLLLGSSEALASQVHAFDMVRCAGGVVYKLKPM